jgi:hypothetical protein
LSDWSVHGQECPKAVPDKNLEWLKQFASKQDPSRRKQAMHGIELVKSKNLGCHRSIVIKPVVKLYENGDKYGLRFRVEFMIIVFCAHSIYRTENPNGQLVFDLHVLNEHHEHCIEFQTQQMLDVGVRGWFEGTTRAGLRPSDALIVYENFVLYGRATADLEPEVCSQAICATMPALYIYFDSLICNQ